ncbi:hypothetical protein E6C50_02065 [Flavobacterium supellecticarium]|uniref:DUF4760 domain-containing protein n=1 Tax=Flavobacterium supellecticarium TaxID=2565924 RepID=A0A4V3W8Y8_9FLAO|nr:hypothetical protein [Flavobacterium supellecticarium]THF53016.1 hypothetical protein E6C50_02065 [Flavobacterium supellecticarium]
MNLENWFDLLQFVCALAAGGFALYLFYISNKERRRSFMFNIFEKLYNDHEIRDVLYAVDKRRGFEALEEKLNNKTIDEVPLERALDKTLRYFDFVGSLVRQKLLDKSDIQSMKLEISEVVNYPTIKRYIDYHIEIGINYNDLFYLKKILD